MRFPFNGLDGFNWFQGVVESVQDPKEIGRIQVRIFGIHSIEKIPNDNTGNGIPTEDLPWANISNSIDSASTSGIGASPVGIVEGTHVWGFARDGRDYNDLVVVGTFVGIPTDKSKGRGFEDPNGVYPTRVNESDLSRLSRGNTKETWIEKNNSNLISNSLFKEPKSKYNAKYPFNHVISTRSGHIFERDDTPDKERLSWVHKTGTFREISPNGDQVDKVVKDRYQLTAGDDYIHVTGNVKIYVNGNVEQVVKGSVTQNIDGDVMQTIKGNFNSESSKATLKASNITLDGAVNATSTIDAKGKINSKVDVEADGVSLVKHPHTGNLGNPTSPPIKG